jgi:TM2 domain-containing membrane protein YozV
MANVMVPCRGCGKQIHKSAPTCPHCGAVQRTTRYKSKTAAGVLAIFIGGLGIHRFYLGQWWGVFYLLLCWTGIPGLISLVEGIVFLCSNPEKWDDKYNEGIAGGREGSAGVVIALVVGVFFFIAVIGILAAIALPAYQDYTMRAKVMGALVEAAPVKQGVEKYVLSKRTLPRSNADAGLPSTVVTKFVDDITIGNDGEVTIRFSQDAGMPLAGKTVLLTPKIEEGRLTWSCTRGTVPEKFRPRDCRGGN